MLFQLVPILPSQINYLGSVYLYLPTECFVKPPLTFIGCCAALGAILTGFAVVMQRGPWQSC